MLSSSASAPDARERPSTSVWIVLLSALAASGAVLAFYHRPGGRGFWAGTHPGRLALHVEFERMMAWGHRAFAFAVAGALVLWLWRSGSAQRREPSVAAVGWLIVTLAALAAAFAVPWESYLPWADAATLTDLPSTRQSDSEGPFPELIALRAHYPHGAADPAWPKPLQSRRALVLAWAHVLLGPLGLLAALFGSRIHRFRQSKESHRQRE